MEKSVIYYTQFIVSVVYFLLFLTMLFDYTRGSKRSNVAQILFFMTIHSFLNWLSINETNISKLQYYAVFMVLTEELTVGFIYNFILISTFEYKPSYKLWKTRNLYTIIPVVLPLNIGILFLLLGFNSIFTVPDSIPFYSIQGFEDIFLSLGFRIYNILFIIFNFLNILICILYSSRKKVLSRSTILISTASMFYVSMILFQLFSPLKMTYSEEQQFFPALMRILLRFFVMCIYITFFFYDGQEILFRGLKRNLLDAFGNPVFLFTTNMEFCYANKEGSELIKKYGINVTAGTKISDFLTQGMFHFIALPQKKGNTEIHYVISLVDDITYTIKRTPLYTRFGNCCGNSVIVSEYENSFLVSSLEESSYTDSLTLCKTSRIFENTVVEMQRNNNKINYVLIKLKNLSRINEELGHSTGDEYIKTTVNLLQASQTGIVFRLESTTFAFFLSETDIENWEQIKKRIENACKNFSAMRSIPLELEFSLKLEAAVSG